MVQFVIIGLSAGAAAALLFASVTSGTLLSVPLFYLAPLPIMIAGLGWGHWAAVAAAMTGAVSLGTIFGFVFLFAFLTGAGVRMVSGRPNCYVDGDPCRACRCGRDPELRHRRRKFSLRPAPDPQHNV